MARIEIYNLYPSNDQQLLNEITEGEIKTVERREGSTVTAGNSDINEQPLGNTVDQNLDNLLYRLRNQMGIVIFGARNQFNQRLNSI
ncbi:hypothetical protein PN483_08225 [Nodularia spumigena CS-591/04]|uniref:Uncharacterized protein n=1 Tax=Nodularia spumigena CENA596 TaxID=1819295 RepID=A0A166JPC7_NODSP|nr:hypothetical protein [Nodularia spumigena]KZL49967.1 hypothetical protein A2T98_09925 [Nodularia spumigena CENA596]MDB9323728.1 hypothetical protein [Nodularia spumigena CS-591/07A]MDB9330475.1 hypothetical protein [Nodularia spumigena CS-591/04]MDB9362550.1 hypothetical protein [Nodularia spumigena CS-588/02]MDB9363236.1 hypothetical protein [Nodularia spumigena CS-588/02A10]